ncbi:MAG: HDOD domain-containing protein [Myxococcota bacterium]
MKSSPPSAAQSALRTVAVARQPIFDVKGNVYAYEMLFREPGGHRASFVDSRQATSQVILTTFVEMDHAMVLDGKPAFINVPEPMLDVNALSVLPRNQVVIEVLEDVSPAIAPQLRQLSAIGFTIALDDFLLSNDLLPLVEIADIVKLDLRALTPAQLEEHVTQLRPFDVMLLAEKVETHEEQRLCAEMGFSLFQGYYFCKPERLEAQTISTNRVSLIELLARVNAPSTQVTDLEAILQTDVSLIIRLMRIINSAFYGLRRPVSSIRHALVLLGMPAVRMWVNLLLLSDAQGKSPELMLTALRRGRMCELIARRNDLRNPEGYFLVGMFSVLDALLDAPVDQLLSSLPLSEDIQAALLDQRGPMGHTLQAVLAAERAEDVSLTDIYLEALGWARQIRAQL